MMETGRPYDSFRVKGVTRSAQAFLYKYRFQKSWTFNLSMGEIEARLELPIVRDQLELIRLRNTSPAFAGEMSILETEPHRLHITWRHPKATATLKADLRDHSFKVLQGEGATEEVLMSF